MSLTCRVPNDTESLRWLYVSEPACRKFECRPLPASETGHFDFTLAVHDWVIKGLHGVSTLLLDWAYKRSRATWYKLVARTYVHRVPYRQEWGGLYTST